MKKILHIVLGLFLFQNVLAQDTFSIVAVDPATGEIGSAAASCVPGVTDPNFIDWLTYIIPNKGVVISQAQICIPNPNLANAITQMEAGLSPSEIIDYLVANDACSTANFNPQFRQYGIADFDSEGNPRSAGFSGSSNDDYAEDRQGPNYSIQGNILLDVSVIDNMEANFNNTNGTLADKLMAALQGANFPGADSRCLNFGTSSRLAFLTVLRPDDDPVDPYLRLSVTSQPDGVEPIDLLQNLYNNFLSLPENELVEKIKIFPNPSKQHINVVIHESVSLISYRISDVFGKIVNESKSNLSGQSDLRIDISKLQDGIYFLKLNTQNRSKIVKFIKG